MTAPPARTPLTRDAEQLGQLTLVEVAVLLAVAQDHSFGQPPGSQLRATVLGQRLAAAAGAGPNELAETWMVSALRFLGCTGHAFEVAMLFGDEIALRSDSLRADSASAPDMVRLMVSHAGPHRSGLGRVPPVLAVLAGGRSQARENFGAACEVADALARRLDLPEPVRRALGSSFERWNGRGLPAGARGTAIPRPMRVAQISQELEVLARIEGVDAALEAIRHRRGRAYDPRLAELALASGAGWWEEMDTADPWEAALAAAPPSPPLGRESLRQALLVIADFADLKSPWTGGHSRAVAELARRAAGSGAEAAALLHDLGRVAVPNTIWDKPGPLSRDERDRAETHALVTDQLLRRLPSTASLAAPASAAHERMDGSGYHRRAKGGHLDRVQRIIAAADCYQAMISDRPHRRARSPNEAAVELRAMASDGRLDGEAVEQVLDAAGQRRGGRTPLPAGLSAREVEVLRLLVLGLTTRQVAGRLSISAKTADHHVQHIYTKIGVSSRGAAALFAIERGLMGAA